MRISNSQWRRSVEDNFPFLISRPISTGVYKDTAVIRTLCTRAATHSSPRSEKADKVNHICALQLNGYPKALIHQHTSFPLTLVPSDTQPRWKSAVVLPYDRGLSVSVRHILTPLEVRVCFKPLRTIRQFLSRLKDPTPDLQKSRVVYKIPCANCKALHRSNRARILPTVG